MMEDNIVISPVPSEESMDRATRIFNRVLSIGFFILIAISICSFMWWQITSNQGQLRELTNVVKFICEDDTNEDKSRALLHQAEIRFGRYKTGEHLTPDAESYWRYRNDWFNDREQRASVRQKQCHSLLTK